MAVLLSVQEALNRILPSVQPGTSESVPLELAAGRIVVERLHATIDLPAFANSSMDGFAIHSAELVKASPQTPVILPVVMDIAAGAVVNQPLPAGSAARIMTGAPMPYGADAVIPIEETDFNPAGSGSKAPETVRCFASAFPGKYVRPIGQDVHAGTALFEAGRRLSAVDVGVLAGLGISQVMVYRKPLVALLSSGDELTPAASPLLYGKIHDSNTPMLAALIQQLGADLLNLGIASDQPEDIRRRLNLACTQKADLILSSGGVSVGAFDYVKSVVESAGLLNFWRVNIRPGKPLAFGNYQNIPLFGLPGNPVSTFVTFQVFLVPYLRQMCGLPALQRRVISAELIESIESDGRESYLRGSLFREGGIIKARLTGHQGSANLIALSQANALLIIPSGVKSLPIGSVVSAIMINGEMDV